MKLLTVFNTAGDSKQRNDGSIALGVAIGIGLNLLQVGLVSFIGDYIGERESGTDRTFLISMIGLGGAGLIQLIYIVPLYLHFRKKEKTETAKGIVIAASLVMLINVFCWGAFGLGK